jgi:hypothetical protein
VTFPGGGRQNVTQTKSVKYYLNGPLGNKVLIL